MSKTHRNPTARNGKQAPRASHAIRESLEEAILIGVIEPGTRLEESVIAARNSVSRTPVREAINQLASAGLVELVANRGAFVRSLKLEDLIEMFEVMADLEAMAGRLAARRRSEAGLVDLKDAMRSCESAADAGDTDVYYAENERFHAVIRRIGGNGFLAEEAARLHRRLSAYRRLQLRVPRRMRQSLAEHGAIVEAIVDGEDLAAEALLRDHIRVQGDRFTDLLATMNASAAGADASVPSPD